MFTHRHRFSTWLLGGALVTVLASGPARAEDWASLGLDVGRSRLSAERSGVAFGPTRWEHSLPPVKDAVYRTLLASPAVADGYLVYGTYGNVVRGLRESDGRTLWERRMADAIHASPAIARGRAYVADLDNWLYALRLGDGGVVWKKDLGGVVYGSPTVAQGSLFVATGDPAARVLRIEAETGRVLWTAGAGIIEQAAHSSLAVGEGHVVAGEVGGRYHGFAMADGTHRWTVETGGAVNMSSPLIVGKRVYLLPGGDDGRLHAIDLATGARIEGWPLDIPVAPSEVKGTVVSRRYVVSSPAGVDRRLVFGRRVEEQLDTNGDGRADSHLLREQTIAVDPDAATGSRVLWSRPTGQVVTTDPNRIPTFGFSPTPALYRTIAGAPMVVVASTLEPKLRVLDLETGIERWSAELSGPTRGSPLVANGRLVVGTDAGVIHSLLSQTNRPPPALELGFSPTGGQDIDAMSATLTWAQARDPDGDAVRYEVRIDDDGEILHDWDLAVVTGFGASSLDVTVPLVTGRTYSYALRSQDRHGAYSGWSALHVFRAVNVPPIQVGETPAGSLAQALLMARPGSTVRLGAGVYPLSNTLRLPPGVILAGVAPHLTTLSGRGLAVAVAAAGGNQLRQLTVADAAVGVEVTSADAVRLENVILRDNTQTGLKVTTGAHAELVSATVVRNGTGVQSAGLAEVRNALITRNRVGIDAVQPAFVVSRYNDVYGNTGTDYQNAQRAATDLSEVVGFTSTDPADLRLEPAQPTTDRGDPTDEFMEEPEPNGGRINIGAFGNTPFAELSGATPPRPAPPSPPTTAPQAPPPPATTVPPAGPPAPPPATTAPPAGPPAPPPIAPPVAVPGAPATPAPGQPVVPAPAGVAPPPGSPASAAEPPSPSGWTSTWQSLQPPSATGPVGDQSDNTRRAEGGLCSLAAPGGATPDGALALALLALLWGRRRYCQMLWIGRDQAAAF